MGHFRENLFLSHLSFRSEASRRSGGRARLGDKTELGTTERVADAARSRLAGIKLSKNKGRQTPPVQITEL
jgi:hypothetical protein